GTDRNPSFCADVAGAFTATLTVFDGTQHSEPAVVTVTAVAPEAALDDLTEVVLALAPPPYGDGTLSGRFARALADELDQAHRALKWEQPDLAGDHLAVFTSQVDRLRD